MLQYLIGKMFPELRMVDPKRNTKVSDESSELLEAQAQVEDHPTAIATSTNLSPSRPSRSQVHPRSSFSQSQEAQSAVLIASGMAPRFPRTSINASRSAQPAMDNSEEHSLQISQQADKLSTGGGMRSDAATQAQKPGHELELARRLRAQKQESKILRAMNDILEGENAKKTARYNYHKERLENTIQLERRAKDRAEVQLQEVGEHVEKLTHDLEDCKAQIFKLNPTAQTNDRQIFEQYYRLCESITDWTHSTFGEIEGILPRMDGANADLTTQLMMVDYLNFGGYGRIFRVNPSIELPMTMWLVLHHLVCSVLDEERQFFGYGAEINGAVAVLEDLKRSSGASTGESNLPSCHFNSMKESKPHVTDQVKLWKADLLTAMVSKEELQQGYNHYLQSVSLWFYPLLKAVLSHQERQDDILPSFHKLTEEAGELSKLFGLSLSSYRFQCDFFPNSPIDSRTLWHDSVNKYKFIDVKTGQDIRGSSSFQRGEDGKVGTMLCVIFPALVREKTENSEEIELQKATVLLEPQFPLIRRGRAKAVAEASPKGTEDKLLSI